MFKKAGRGRQLLTLALFAVPWFFRDQFATSLDEHTRNVQEALVEKANHEERQQQDADQREVRDMLSRIELNHKSADHNVTEDQIAADAVEYWSKTAHEDGDALMKDVEVFDKLRGRISMDAQADQEMDHVSQEARMAAHNLSAFTYSKDSTPEDDKATEQLYKQFIKADDQLVDAWDKVTIAAEEDQRSSGIKANVSRFIAWICTAIGALMVGGWKKVVDGLNTEAEA
jgi:hypothetical protein